MGDFEEKLNAILGDQRAMGQIMALAQSLGGSLSAQQEDPQGEDQERETHIPSEPSPPSESPASEPASDPSASLLSGLGGLDPNLLQLGMKLFQEYQGKDQETTALLTALRPFLQERRRAKLDRAVQIAKLSRMIRIALQTMGKKGEQTDHV